MPRYVTLFFCIFIFSGSAVFAADDLPDAPRYTIKAEFDAANHRITASETVRYVNTTGLVLNELHFNIYANKQYSREERRKVGFFQNYFKANMFPSGPHSADFKINSATCAGLPLQYFIEGQYQTALRLMLDKPLEPGEAVQVDFDFSVVLPNQYGLLGYSLGVNYCAYWYPMLSVYKDGFWHDNPLGTNHLPYFSDASYYDVELTVPVDQTVAHSGSLQSQETLPGNKKLMRITAGPVREFTFAASFLYRLKSETVDGINLKLYYLPFDADLADVAFADIKSAMKFYVTHYGPYPYSDYSVVETHIGWLGNQFSNLSFIDSRGFNLPDILYRHLDFLISHEMAHQWWGIQVGCDEFRQTWLHEAFASYAGGVYLESKYGKDDNYLVVPRWASFLPNTSFREARTQRYMSAVRNNADEVAIKDIDKFTRPENVFVSPYDKGLWTLDMLNYLTGPEKFDRIMREHIERYRFKTVETGDFIRLAQSVYGSDLEGFFQQWLYTRDKCDYGLSRVKRRKLNSKWVVEFTVKRYAQAIMPVQIKIVTQSGQVINQTWDGKDLQKDYRIETDSAAVLVDVDPDRRLLDYRLDNNTWPAKKKVQITPFYGPMYDFPILNPSDAYSVVFGTTFNVFNFGVRLSGRRIFDYMTYAECRYDFAHNLFQSLAGQDIERPFGLGDSILNFEAGYDHSPDSPERFLRGRLSLTKRTGPAIYSIDKVENHIKMYYESNREVALDKSVYRRAKFGLERSYDYRILTWDPVAGYRLRLSGEYGPRIFGANSKFVKGEIDGRLYTALFSRPDLILANRLDLGLSHGDVVGEERFSLGGQDSLRGYGDGRFRSRNKLLYACEFRFPLVGEQEQSLLRNFFTFNRLNGAIFYETGVPWDDSFSSAKTQPDIGLGLRFEVTVLGFFEKTLNRLDFAYPLRNDYRGKRTLQVCFNIMHAF